jgi:hypothetical protein
MLKNITMSAEEFLVQKARQKALKEKMSLNDLFRQWLLKYTTSNQSAQDYKKIMKQMKHVDAGRKFNRDEANER